MLIMNEIKLCLPFVTFIEFTITCWYMTCVSYQSEQNKAGIPCCRALYTNTVSIHSFSTQILNVILYI